MKPVRRILIPTDGSRHTRVVLEVVQTRYPQAQPRLLHVGRAGQMFSLFMPSSLSAANGVYLPYLLQEIEAEEWARLRRLAQEWGVQAVLRQGEVVEGIVEEALVWKADMVALHHLGRRLRCAPSVSQSLLRRLPLEVMVVHLPKRVVEIYVGWAEPEALKGSLALEKRLHRG